MKKLELGQFSDEELEELADEDVQGGTTWSCALVTAGLTVISSQTCPTSRCTQRCKPRR